MSRRNPIIVEATELTAAMALRSARSSDELVSVWWRDCEHYTGEARERLQVTYADCLRQFAPLQRAG